MASSWGKVPEMDSETDYISTSYIKFSEQRLTVKLGHLLTYCSLIKPITNLMQAPRFGGSLLNSIFPPKNAKSRMHLQINSTAGAATFGSTLNSL